MTEDKKHTNSRARQRRARQRRNRRILTTVCLMALVMVVSIGGTIAWLTAETDPVVNTFTVGDINIELTETWNTDTDNDSKNDAWRAKLIPGEVYVKDPVVTVKANSEKCYLFVQFAEDGNAQDYLNYESTLTTENGWTKGDGTDIPGDVWYRTVESSAVDQTWDLLKDDEITVDQTAVTKENMQTAAGASLTYRAYACQFDNISTVAEAWSKVKPTT